MSTNRHVIHAWIDGRGSSSKGTAMLYAVYRNLGSAEVEDQITVTRSANNRYYIGSLMLVVGRLSSGKFQYRSLIKRRPLTRAITEL